MTENDILFDVKTLKPKAIDFFKKHYIWILILIPIFLAANIRLYSESLPIMNDVAMSNVQNYYKNNIAQQYVQQYPNLPAQQLQNLITQEYNKYYATNKASISQQADAVASQLKARYQDENGYTYMPDIDPYTYLQRAQNYLDHGYIGDIKINNTMYDMHMLAPKGAPLNPDLHPIVLAYLYKVMHMFNSKITLMQSASYFPIIVVCLAIIPVFLVGRKFSNSIGGFFSALIFAISPALLLRTSWGHADTDAYNIFFPVWIICFFFLALDEQNKTKRIVYSVISGLFIGLFMLFWTGWWYIFYFMIGGLILYCLYLFILKTPGDIKEYAKSLGIFILSSCFFVSLFSSPKILLNYLFVQPFEFLAIKEASHATLWPNVYTTVAEMSSASLNSIIGNMGGSIFFYGALLGLLFMIFNRKYLYQTMFLSLWFFGIIFASTKGVRFVMMLTPPLALLVGYLFGFAYEKFKKYMGTDTLIKKSMLVVSVGVMCVILLPTISADYSNLKQDVPMVNDAWISVYDKIKMESKPNAIINSWWDFGHQFKYLADRAVTFDGATQNTPMAYWIGKTLLTSDEKLATGILRMLDCGSTDAFNLIDSQINDTSLSVKLLNDIIIMSKDSARHYLTQHNIKNIENILTKTHCQVPEDYFITSDDMISKGGVFFHFGSWNFDRADMWIYGRSMTQEEFEKVFGSTDLYYDIRTIANEAEANNWIAPWPGYGNRVQCMNSSNNTINCGGVIIDKNTKEVDIQGKKPNAISYVENKQFYVKNFDNGIGQSLILQHNEDTEVYIMTACSPEVTDSMFTRLYFYDGIGLKNFKKFTEAQQPTGGMIYVWKVELN